MSCAKLYSICREGNSEGSDIFDNTTPPNEMSGVTWKVESGDKIVSTHEIDRRIGKSWSVQVSEIILRLLCTRAAEMVFDESVSHPTETVVQPY